MSSKLTLSAATRPIHAMRIAIGQTHNGERPRADHASDPRVYALYGIRLASRWPLPGLENATAGPVDVELLDDPSSLDAAARHLPASQDWFRRHELPDGSSYLRWESLGDFLVASDGRRIAARLFDGVPPEAFSTYLLGQVLSFSLLRFGFEPLHATVPVSPAGAIALLGDSGYGKSSLGATFVQARHPLLTDDVLVLKEENGAYLAQPGPPRIKLFPQIKSRTLGDHLPGTPMNHLTPKLIIPLRDQHRHPDPAPLKAIYVLAPPESRSPRKRITIRRLPTRLAFVHLLRNTFNRTLRDPARLKRQFAFATALISRVPVKMLSYPRDLNLLPAIRDAILSDLAN